MLFFHALSSTALATTGVTCDITDEADGRTYAVCNESGATFTRAEAAAQCSSLYGSTLATVETSGQQAALRNTRNSGGVGLAKMWIGLQEVDSTNTFVWDSGSPLLPTDFSAWRTSNPNHVGAGSCVHFWQNSPGPWDDTACGASLIAFACDYVAPVVPPTVSERVDTMAGDVNDLAVAAWGGSGPVDEGSSNSRLRPSQLTAQLEAAVAALQADGCSVDDGDLVHAAGVHLHPLTGLDSSDVALTDLELDIAARTFGFVASSMGVGTSVSEFSIFHASRGTMVAATDAGSNTFVAGRWARIQGSRGVFLTLGGTCPETGADPVGTLMADWF